MNFTNPFKNDNFEDLKRQEEYQRQQNIQLTKTAGNALYKYIIYAFIYFISYLTIAIIMKNVIGFDYGVSMFISVVGAFVIFKIPYLKINPFKSLIILSFLFFLIYIVLS